ncbi:MAG: hypothetical protein P0120_12240 [Nitrospira sp.]|nr:hypothetical protein [Nitrospira sp.]
MIEVLGKRLSWEGIADKIGLHSWPGDLSAEDGSRIILPMNQTATLGSLGLPRPTMHPFMDITAKEAPMLSNF